MTRIYIVFGTYFQVRNIYIYIKRKKLGRERIKINERFKFYSLEDKSTDINERIRFKTREGLLAD